MICIVLYCMKVQCSVFVVHNYIPCQDRAKHMLLEQQVVLEEFGGDIQAVPISALTVSPFSASENDPAVGYLGCRS